MIVYEYPFNERIRTLLRLEDLYEKFKFFVHQEHPMQHHVALSTIFDMLEVAGGTDVMADVHRQSVAMSSEMVLARAPDVIVELRYAPERSDSSDINVWNTLASVPAVKNHRIILLTGEEFVVPGPRVGDATKKLAAAIHPELRW